MNKNCANCKFWGVQWPTVCDRITMGYERDAPYIRAVADDDQGIHATLKTPSTFGCTLFVDANEEMEEE